MAAFTDDRIRGIKEIGVKMGRASTREPKMVREALFHGMRVGGSGGIRDLNDLSILANQSVLYWVALYQGVRALHERQAESICHESILQVEREISWLTTELKQAAPQALTIPPDRVKQALTIAKKLPTTAVLPGRAPSFLKAATLTGAGLVGYLIGRRRAA